MDGFIQESVFICVYLWLIFLFSDGLLETSCFFTGSTLVLLNFLAFVIP